MISPFDLTILIHRMTSPYDFTKYDFTIWIHHVRMIFESDMSCEGISWHCCYTISLLFCCNRIEHTSSPTTVNTWPSHDQLVLWSSPIERFVYIYESSCFWWFSLKPCLHSDLLDYGNTNSELLSARSMKRAVFNLDQQTGSVHTCRYVVNLETGHWNLSLTREWADYCLWLLAMTIVNSQKLWSIGYGLLLQTNPYHSHNFTTLFPGPSLSHTCSYPCMCELRPALSLYVHKHQLLPNAHLCT